MSETVVKPFTPDDVERRSHGDDLPDFVFEAVNELLVEGFIKEGMCITLGQEAIVKRIMKRGGIEDSKIVYKHYLTFAKFYRENGWGVTHNGLYEYFQFEPKA